MHRRAPDASRWQSSFDAVDDLIAMLNVLEAGDPSHSDSVRLRAENLSSAATRLAKRQSRAESAALVVAFVLSFCASLVWVAQYPMTAIPRKLQGQGDTEDVLRRVFEYTDLTASVAYVLVFVGSFALMSWGLAYGAQQWMSPGEITLRLVQALDVVVAKPSDLRLVANRYAKVEAAFLTMPLRERTQYARARRRAEATAAAACLGQLEIELRGVHRVPATHRPVLVRLVGVVMLDDWDAVNGTAAPESLTGRLAAAGHAAPLVTRIAGRVAAGTAVLPVIQLVWTMLQELAK